MITYQKYVKILKAQGLSKNRYFLTDLIYSRGEEKMTKSLAKRLGEIIHGIDEGNYTIATLKDFTKTELGIEGRVLVKRDFSRWNKKD